MEYFIFIIVFAKDFRNVNSYIPVWKMQYSNNLVTDDVENNNSEGVFTRDRMK